MPLVADELEMKYQPAPGSVSIVGMVPNQVKEAVRSWLNVPVLLS